MNDEIKSLESWLDDAIDAGIDLIQIRERDLDGGLLAATTTRIVRRAVGTSTRVVVNDRADVAFATGAAGVHVRDDGPPVRRLQALAESEWMIGRSVHRVEALPLHATATYVIFGTIFQTLSKSLDAPVQGVDGLRAAVTATRVPVLAIGGIDVANARTCINAGARGVAAIGLFLPEGRERGAVGVFRAVREIKHV